MKYSVLRRQVTLGWAVGHGWSYGAPRRALVAWTERRGQISPQSLAWAPL